MLGTESYWIGYWMWVLGTVRISSRFNRYAIDATHRDGLFSAHTKDIGRVKARTEN
jgi:hypothetical protein